MLNFQITGMHLPFGIWDLIFVCSLYLSIALDLVKRTRKETLRLRGSINLRPVAAAALDLIKSLVGLIEQVLGGPAVNGIG